MARSLGCKNLIILSRSAKKHPDSEALLSDLKATGCNAFLGNCDVSNEAELRIVLDQASQSLPLVRGVIQAAMTLNVSSLPILSKQVSINLKQLRTLFSPT